MLIKTNSKMDMPELIELALNTKLKVGNFFIGNYWRDIGTPSNLDSAREEVHSETNKDE
jgi:NDP-sugar pyrophosphorylase family protein